MEWKKRIYVAWLGVSILTVLALFSTDVAAVPEVVQYQGYLTDSGGSPFLAKIEVVDVPNLQADVDGDGRISLVEAVYVLGKLAEEGN
jgi:hypothetical protein